MRRRRHSTTSRVKDKLPPALSIVQNKEIVNELMVDGWAIRRRVMILSLLYCAGNVQYLLMFGLDSQLNRELGSTLVYAGVAIIGSYVFGAVWDDKDRRNTMREYDTTYSPNNLPPGVE